MNKQYLKTALEYLLDYNNYLAEGLWDKGSAGMNRGMYIQLINESMVIWVESRFYKTSWDWTFEKGLVILPLSEGRVEMRIRGYGDDLYLVSEEPYNISDYFEDPHNITGEEVGLFSTIEGGEVPFLLCIYEWLLRVNNTQKNK